MMAIDANLAMTAFADLIRNQNEPFFRIWEINPLTGDLSQDISKWFENFEYQSNLVSDITDENRFLELRKSLKDRALNIFQSATNINTRTYALAKTFLLTNLVYPHQIAIWRQQFHNRKKNGNETVADYLRDLKT